MDGLCIVVGGDCSDFVGDLRYSVVLLAYKYCLYENCCVGFYGWGACFAFVGDGFLRSRGA